VYVKKIVCLANSRKTAGRCIAGKELDRDMDFGDWIRPVSDRPTQEVSEEERRYENGADPQLLDIISVPLLEHQPHAHQSENHLIDDSHYWTKRGKANWAALQAAIDDDAETLWGTDSSSYYGMNDRIPEQSAPQYQSSLMLIEPTNFEIVVAVEGREFNNPRRKVRATFDWKGTSYTLPVTDPVIERQYLAGDTGTFPLEDVLVCVSLGEPHTDHYCYKFCAAIITPERAGR
jgi:hypothetical protein